MLSFYERVCVGGGGGGGGGVVLVAIVAMHGTLVRVTMAPLSRPSQKIIPPWPPEAPDPP